MASPSRLAFLYYLLVVIVAQLASCFQLPKLITGRQSVMFPLRVTSADSEMNWDPKSGPKLDFNEDYYSVLDVEVTVDMKDLKKAYYKLVFKYHPDNIENESSKSMCNKQMMVINGAYRILKNINLRVMYDRQRRKGLVGAGAGIKESSINTDGSKPVNAPKPPQASEQQQKVPPKSADADTSSKGQGKKYSGTGFGGSWSSPNEEDQEYDDDVEEEYNDQERERERQRQRYQEPQPQPQTQRERDQQVRDREKEFDFTYDQRGTFTTPKRTPWGFNTNTYEEPVRPAGTYREDNLDDINNVEEFLRRSGSGVSDIFDDNVSALKRKLEILCARKVQREKEMDRMSASVGDWGEVTDVRLIRKRIEDINEVKSLTQEISELADEIADMMLRSRISSNDRNYGNSRGTSSSRSSPQGSGYRPPVDLWGESPSPSPSSSPRPSTRPPPPRASTPSRSATPPTRGPVRTAKPIPGSVDWDAGRNNVKGFEDDYLDYNFDEETLEDFGGGKENERNGDSNSNQSPWRKSYQDRRNPNASNGNSNSNGQAFASFLFEDEPPIKRDYEGDDVDEYEEAGDEDADEEIEGAQNSAVLNELLRIFNLSKKGKK